VNKKEHLNEIGLMKIISLRASLNKGLSNKLKSYFPNIIKTERSHTDTVKNIDKN